MSKSTLMIRGIIRVLVQIGISAALLFIPVGTWHWPRAIQLLAVFGLVQLIATVALARLPVVARIVVEERTLRETLPGYTGYMRKVPYRLVPRVW